MQCKKILSFLCLLSPLFSSDFNNEFNHTSPEFAIKRVHISGERNSGTTFLECLMQKNFPAVLKTEVYGFKHFLWWFGTPLDAAKLKQFNRPRAVDLSESEDCLFISIVRNPYDWLRSFFFGIEPTFQSDFSHFLRMRWKHLGNHPYFRFVKSLDNQNPWTGKPFSSILELRKYKTLNFLALGERVKHYCFVRYEDLRDDPQGFVDFLASYYNIGKTEEFIPITLHRGGVFEKTSYKKKTYPPFSLEDKEYIDSTLDWEVENRVGYFIIDSLSP
jgi:hypothetical protein